MKLKATQDNNRFCASHPPVHILLLVIYSGCGWMQPNKSYKVPRLECFLFAPSLTREQVSRLARVWCFFSQNSARILDPRFSNSSFSHCCFTDAKISAIQERSEKSQI